MADVQLTNDSWCYCYKPKQRHHLDSLRTATSNAYSHSCTKDFGSTLAKSPVHHRAYIVGNNLIHSHSHLEFRVINLTCISLDCGRTCTDTGRMWKLHTERPRPDRAMAHLGPSCCEVTMLTTTPLYHQRWPKH